MPRYDVAIIGTGPAGLEAAVNLKIRNKSFLLFGSERFSAKLETAPKIENYLGYPAVTGKKLASRFGAHLKHMEIGILAEYVSMIYHMGDYYALATAKNIYEATTVILATGAHHGTPLPGESELLGKGVGYCATCDAPLYKGKKVAVVGYSDESVYEANFLAEVCGTVYYIPQKPAKAVLDSAVILKEDKAVSIRGDTRVEALVLQREELAVDGVFILRETIAPNMLLPGLLLNGPFISVDMDMQTNLPGCFAAGDCTGKPHQYMRAAGQGQTAALNAAAYLDRIRQKKHKQALRKEGTQL